MALSNLITVSFTAAELTTLDTAIQNIADVLKNKAVNLTPEQRSQYGSINEENKLLVNKVKDTESAFPDLHPAFLDLAEFETDFASRQQIETRAEQLASLSEKLSDTKILLDFDNYNYAVSYYRYIKMLSTQEVPGSTSVYENLRQVYESQLAAARRAMNEKDRQASDAQTPEEV